MTTTINTIFLLGSERSGSNLLTRMFDAHPAICGPAPTHIGSDLLGNLQRYPRLHGADREDFLSDFLALFESKMGAWQTEPDRDKIARVLDQEGPLAAYLSLYRGETDAAEKAISFIKENRLYRWAPLLIPVVAVTGFIYLCRDPRDMALSWQNAPALRGGVLRAARIWAADQAGFLALRAQLEAATGRAIPVVRYEALLDAPENTLHAACQALGVPFDRCMLDFHVHDEIQAQALQVQEWKNIGTPLIAGNHGKFREALSKDVLSVIEGTCRDAMQSLGYKPTQPPLDPDALAVARKGIEADEPWSKPAYQQLSDAEQQRRRRQHAVFTRIRGRSFTVSRD